jgi:hypothetical protein
MRTWRKNHPEYIERERERRKERAATRRRQREEERSGKSFGEVIRGMVQEEVGRIGQRELSRRTLLDHSGISRQVRGERPMTQEYVDTYVAYFGLRTIVARYNAANGRVQKSSAPGDPSGHDARDAAPISEDDR